MAFGLRYYAELRSKHKEVFWRVEIAERGFVGQSEEMAFDGGSPLSITWEKRGDEFFIPVKASEATVNILCQRNFHYINLFTSDPRKFRVSVYRNTKLYWRGYVVADLYSENFTAPPYQVSIKAVDGFNLLSSIPFKNLDNTPITGRKSVWELVASCIDLLELEVNVADWMDLYAEGKVSLRYGRSILIWSGSMPSIPIRLIAMCWNSACAPLPDRYSRVMVRYISAEPSASTTIPVQ
mgnify:CR=1 FL=1